MAVPTVTSVSPSTGSTRGDNMVKVIGTNFKLPDAPPPFGPLHDDQQKTVSVKFEGQGSAWAYAATDTLILARVPEYRGAYDVPYPVALDVRVANLDTAGVEIVGENAILADGYGVDRPGLAGKVYLQHAVAEFLKLFRRHVLQNTHMSASRDAVTGVGDERLRASAPAVYLIGPQIVEDRLHSVNQELEEADPGDATQWHRKRFPVTVDLEFRIGVVSDGNRHLYGLTQALIMFFRDVVHVRVPDNPAAPAGPYKDYEIDMAWAFRGNHDDEPNKDDLFKSIARASITGVQVDDYDGTIIESGWFTDADQPTLDTQYIPHVEGEFTFVVDDNTGFYLTDDSGHLIVEG